jgi:hypothetical protein
MPRVRPRHGGQTHHWSSACIRPDQPSYRVGEPMEILFDTANLADIEAMTPFYPVAG